MLSLRGVKKAFGRVEALRGVDLEIGQGEIFGLLGPNGAGKSTLMNLITGYHDPDEGTFEFDGNPVWQNGRRAADAHARLGYVPQRIALYEELNAWQNIGIFGSLYGLSHAQRQQRGEELLQSVQLTDRANDKVKAYSGGMQRRLNIACSLLHGPDCLLCDEPTVGVDPQSRNAIFDFLEERRAAGMTVVYSTHYMEEATRLCDRIAIIDHGRILACGTLQELIDQLDHSLCVRLRKPHVSEKQARIIVGEDELVEADLHWDWFPGPALRLSEIYARTEAEGIEPRHVESKRPTLEDLFLHLTGRSLRE